MIRSSLGRGFLLFLFLLLVAGTPAVPASAQGEHHAALVVDFGDGRVVVRVVAFTGESISGVELLQRSGLDVALLGGMGGSALCAVEGVGCPPTPQDCFCQCRGGSCRYWSYFHLQGGIWVYASTGASGRFLRDGDVDGWVWGDGKTPPPLLSWEEIWARSGPAAPTFTIPPPAPTATTPPPTTAPPFAPATPRPSPAPSPSPLPSSPTLDAKATDEGATAMPTSTAAPTVTAPAAPETLLSRSQPPATVTGERGKGQMENALAFGTIALLLLAIGLWVRRRR